MEIQVKEDGLNMRDWAQTRKRFLLSGIIDHHTYVKLSQQQQWFIHQLELTMKSIEEEEIKK